MDKHERTLKSNCTIMANLLENFYDIHISVRLVAPFTYVCEGIEKYSNFKTHLFWEKSESTCCKMFTCT